MSTHRAWIEIDLEAFRRNLRRVCRRAGSSAVWPVLKANAYGHGAVLLARVCAEEGVARIGVGDSSEALELRAAGVRVPLLILGTVIDAEVPALLEHDIEVGVHSESRVRKLGRAARRAGRRLGVHLKVDTGLGRLGVRPEAAVRVAAAVAEEPALDLRGLMTHYAATAGFLDPFTAEQARIFAVVRSELAAAGLGRPPAHAASSAALFTTPGATAGAEEAVRPGIALYGMLPGSVREHDAQAAELEPVLALRTQVVFLKDVPPGTPVGYGHRWRARRPTRLAVLPLGYCDGVPWRLGLDSGRGGACALVRGRRCPLVGAVSMDYCCVDVTDVPGTGIGDPVTLVGRDGEVQLRVQEVAAAAGTIPHEITCTLGRRLRRVVVGRPAPAAAGGDPVPARP